MRTLLINEAGLDPARLVPVLHYDGTPITERYITAEIASWFHKRGKVTQMDAAE